MRDWCFPYEGRLPDEWQTRVVSLDEGRLLLVMAESAQEVPLPLIPRILHGWLEAGLAPNGALCYRNTPDGERLVAGQNGWN